MTPQWHAARLAEQIREEVEEMVAGELKDPRIGLVTVTHIVLSGDLHHARVLVSASGDDAERGKTLEGLASSAEYVGHEVGRRLQMRRALEVVFVPDPGAGAEQKIEDALDKLKERE
ncbi:MAG: 30S ribosome-binding factor RbfA [Terriglobia bacterium]|jgi:ribosome-binding factor A